MLRLIGYHPKNPNKSRMRGLDGLLRAFLPFCDELGDARGPQSLWFDDWEGPGARLADHVRDQVPARGESATELLALTGDKDWTVDRHRINPRVYWNAHRGREPLTTGPTGAEIVAAFARIAERGERMRVTVIWRFLLHGPGRAPLKWTDEHFTREGINPLSELMFFLETGELAQVWIDLNFPFAEPCSALTDIWRAAQRLSPVKLTASNLRLMIPPKGERGSITLRKLPWDAVL
jgi:hypothetical protein